MNYCEIKFTDVANGPGVRVSLFVSGCRHRCEGCFNPETWDFSFGQPFTEQTEQAILEALENDETYGLVLRAKGMVASGDGTWIYFDYVPGESDVREGKPDVTGKICVIGSNLNEENLKKLFERN